MAAICIPSCKHQGAFLFYLSVFMLSFFNYSWPSTRNLQFKTVLFLATALFGKNFAAEYARLIFFSPTDGTGRGKGKGLGVGIFRRKTKKRDNAEAPAVKGKSKAWQSLQEQRKKAQLAESSADEVIMDEMACADLIGAFSSIFILIH